MSQGTHTMLCLVLGLSGLVTTIDSDANARDDGVFE